MTIEITYTDAHGRERLASVSETFPHQGTTSTGHPVQVVYDWDWTEVPIGAPNPCDCERCDPDSEVNDTAVIRG